jgi:hypothetical protein
MGIASAHIYINILHPIQNIITILPPIQNIITILNNTGPIYNNIIYHQQQNNIIEDDIYDIYDIYD